MTRVSTGARIGLASAVALVSLAVGYGLSVGLSGYLVYLGTSAIVSSIAVLGLGIVTGSAGMIALCQLTFAAVGAWVVSWLNSIDAPGGLLGWLVLGGLAAGAVGILVGLPALRLRGVNLAVVTLGLAAAADLVLVQIQFPGTTTGTFLTRPGFADNDRSYFFLGVIVLVLCCLSVHVLQHSRWGSGWRSVAFSERGTASAGASVRGSKLSAFAVSAMLGGLSGGLITGQVGLAFAASFTPIQSLALYVLAVMSGAHLIDMAIFGGILWVAVPELLKRWGISQDWGFVIFGALGVQALASGSNLGSAVRELWWKRTRERETEDSETPDRPVSEAVGRPPRPSPEPVLVASALSVSFGQVKALNSVELAVPEYAVVGLIGPNGAGKSTLVDVVSGFLPAATGTVTVAGQSFGKLSPTGRARRGLRRTFQQDRVPPSLTIDAYLRFVARRRVTSAEVTDTLAFFGCPAAHTRLASVDVGTRRIVEVVGHLLSKPRVLLLDEPTAGLSHEQHVAFGERLRQVPARFGASVLLIEHDLDLVRAVCDTITVLDFGMVLASGPQHEVLAEPAVLKAYMGETEPL